MRIEERLRESANRYGAHPAVVAGRARHSYAELDLKSERLAAALAGGGVTRGERAMVFLDDGWEAVVSAFAVLKTGGVVVPVGTAATAGQLADRLQASQPVAVITQSRLAAMVAAEISALWSVRLIVLAGGDRARAGGTCISFEETIERIGHVRPLPAAGSDDDTAMLDADGTPRSHREIGEDAAAIAVPADGFLLPPLAERTGLSRLLAAIDAGRTMTARALFAHGDERRPAERRSADLSFRIERLGGAATVGAEPVFQR